VRRWVILDRDGVINHVVRGQYITSPEQVSLLPGAADAIARLNDNDYSVVVVSNQQCVGLGLLTQAGLDAVSDAVREAVCAASGGIITDFFYCPHLKDAGCACRKPRPGLLHAAQQRHGFELATTYFVGDMYSDVLTAKHAACRSIFVLGGLDDLLYREGQPFPHTPDHIADDLAAATEYILTR